MKVLAANVLSARLCLVFLSMVAVCRASIGIRGAETLPEELSTEKRGLQQVDLFARPLVCEQSLSIELNVTQQETLGNNKEFLVAVQIKGLIEEETWKLTKVTMATNGLPSFEALQISPVGNITFFDAILMPWSVEIEDRNGGHLFALATATAMSDETGKQCVISNTISR